MNLFRKKKFSKAVQWADLPDEEVYRLIKESKKNGWWKALELYEKQHPFFVKRMKNLGLGDWHLILSKEADSRVLDVGCGFGSMILGFSKHFSHVYGLEYLPERISFAKLRAFQEARNVYLIRGSGLKLPFGEAVYQLVTFNGVLEWAGLYDKTKSPGTLQREMLAEANRVISDDGVVAVTIENSFAMESLTGMSDTHTGIHFITFLPRWIADMVSLFRSGGNYRTYLYRRRGYQDLFRKAGFQQIKIFDLISSYNDYDYVVNTLDTASYEFLYDHKLIKSFYSPAGIARSIVRKINPSILKEVSYAYLVVGGKSVLSVLDDEHEIWKISKEYGLDIGSARFACRGNKPGTMVIICHENNHVVMIVELLIKERVSEEETNLFPDWLKTRYSFQRVREPLVINGVQIKVHRVLRNTHL